MTAPGSMQRDNVRISSRLFEAYLKCPTKCFLRSLGDAPSDDSYANWVNNQEISYIDEGIKHLVEGVAQIEVITGPIDPRDARPPKWRIAIRAIVRTPNFDTTIHAVE
jgi:hypothetical protein